MRLPSLRTLCRVLLVLLLCAEKCVAVKWLALYRVRHRQWTKTRNCTKSLGLVSKQTRICRNNLDLMPTIVDSTLLTIHACQAQFSDRRWNCSSILNVPSLPRDLLRGTREQAFVYGLSAAALTYAMAVACSSDATTKCTCGPLPNTPTGGEFKWGGCSHNIYYGLYFGERFTNATLQSKKGRIKTSKKALMNRHNFEVGRMVVRASLKKTCKCHGVSGSCSIQTCWMGLPKFYQIAAALKEKYTYAVEVKRKRRKKAKILVPTRTRSKPFSNDQLAYYERSPDYCSPDPKTGSLGTVGRLCDDIGKGHRSCRNMCCGREHVNFTRTVKERCKYKFRPPVYVTWKICTRVLQLNRCL